MLTYRIPPEFRGGVQIDDHVVCVSHTNGQVQVSYGPYFRRKIILKSGYQPGTRDVPVRTVIKLIMLQ